jgi:hypothetical protein
VRPVEGAPGEEISVPAAGEPTAPSNGESTEPEPEMEPDQGPEQEPEAVCSRLLLILNSVVVAVGCYSVN